MESLDDVSKTIKYLFVVKIYQTVKIVMLRWNVLQYLSKLLPVNCHEWLEILLTWLLVWKCFIGVHKKLKLAEMMSEILVSKQNQEQSNINIWLFFCIIF